MTDHVRTDGLILDKPNRKIEFLFQAAVTCPICVTMRTCVLACVLACVRANVRVNAAVVTTFSLWADNVPVPFGSRLHEYKCLRICCLTCLTCNRTSTAFRGKLPLINLSVVYGPVDDELKRLTRIRIIKQENTKRMIVPASTILIVINFIAQSWTVV